MYTENKKKPNMAEQHSACTNPVCVQFRIQHKNVTLKRLELEKEIDQMRRAQSNQFNQAVEDRSVTQVRDASSGEMGLMMKNGEVMTPQKVAMRMEIAAKCMESLQTSEKHNRQLVEENRILKQNQELTYNEMRRLERILNGFEKTRRYEVFTDEHHRSTLEQNEKMACDIDKMEHRLHVLQEENEIMKQTLQRKTIATAARVMIDEDSTDISSFVTSDGRIPPTCPCDETGCASIYEFEIIRHSNPTMAFTAHMTKAHKVCS